MTRLQRNNRITHSRRRNCRGNELQGSEDNEDENDNKDSSSADERCTEVRQRRRKRRAGTRSGPSSSAANSDGGCIENDLEISRENRGISPGLVWNPELLAWGRAGTRSHTRHGNPSGCNSKSSQNTRLSKLVDYLRSLEENNNEVEKGLLHCLFESCTGPWVSSSTHGLLNNTSRESGSASFQVGVEVIK
jgi:E3 ubiquitin-protein ligase RNF1/2